MYRATASTQRVYDGLAQLFFTADGSRALGLLNTLGREMNGNKPPVGTRGHVEKARVGIWKALDAGKDSRFKREESARSTLWADVDEIPSRGNKKRVVLIGESVARGYFYDPYNTPARALEQIIGAACDSEAEVIDLARSGIGLFELLELLQASVALNPDIIVIFAGNNWLNDVRSSWTESRELATTICESRCWSSVKSYFERKLIGYTDGFLETVSSLSSKTGIRSVVVIPEFNLRDWEDHAVDLPMLDPEELVAWRDAHSAATAAMSAKDFSSLAAAASRMIELDGGTMSSGLRALAECRLVSGDLACARALFERARDSVLAFPTYRVPRCPSVVQRRMREGAQLLGIKVVDLPTVFRERNEKDLPGRSLFLDYCHMTWRGIDVAIAAIAEAILPELSATRASTVDWKAATSPPPANISAMASFLAAHHNYMWGQDREIVHYHCEAAISQSPSVINRMKEFVDFQTRAAQVNLCSSFLSFTSSEEKALAHHLHSLRKDKTAKLMFIDTIIEACQDAEPSLRAETDMLRVEEHNLVPEQPFSLLDTYYLRDDTNTQMDPKTRHGYHRSWLQQSHFFFVSKTASQIYIDITCRVPGASTEDAKTIISINEIPVLSVQAGDRWTSGGGTVCASVLKSGVNSVCVSWPVVGRQLSGALEQVIDSIGDSERSFSAFYGELCCLSVRQVHDVREHNQETRTS
jgi:hypothetical protein